MITFEVKSKYNTEFKCDGNYQDIENKYESEGSQESEDEYVEGERGLSVDDVALTVTKKPDYVAALTTVASDHKQNCIFFSEQTQASCFGQICALTSSLWSRRER